MPTSEGVPPYKTKTSPAPEPKSLQAPKAPEKPLSVSKSLINPSLRSLRPDGHGIDVLPNGPETKFSWEIVKEIILRMQKGEFLTDICDIKKNPHLCDYSTFSRWMAKKPKIAEWVERSRKIASNIIAEKSVTLFFEEPPTETLQTKNGSIERISMSGVQRERYASQALMSLASKWNPDVYGDKIQMQGQFDVFNIITNLNGQKLKKQAKVIETEAEK